MADKRVIKAAIAAVVSVGLSCGLFASPASAQSLSDRFKGLFGGKSDEQPAPNATPGADDNMDRSGLTCPEVKIRAGASTFAVGTSGKEAVGNDLKFQATITKTARECSING